MSSAPSGTTPSRLWKHMSASQRLDAARAFWGAADAADDQVQAALLISREKKFRPKTVFGLDRERKTRHLASLPNLPDAVAGRVLVVYHLVERRPMMGAFLDALGIEHENGLIKDDKITPSADAIASAVAALAERYPPADVSLYLNTLLCQDPETWGALRDLPQLQA